MPTIVGRGVTIRASTWADTFNHRMKAMGIRSISEHQVLLALQLTESYLDFITIHNFHHSWYNLINIPLINCLPHPWHHTREPLWEHKVLVLGDLLFSTALQSNPNSGMARLCPLSQTLTGSSCSRRLSATYGMSAPFHLSTFVLFFKAHRVISLSVTTTDIGFSLCLKSIPVIG